MIITNYLFILNIMMEKALRIYFLQDSTKKMIKGEKDEICIYNKKNKIEKILKIQNKK